MNMNRLWLLAAGAFVVPAILNLSGCAVEGPVKPVVMEQKIKSANTRADHDELADIYERQAKDDRAASERHRELAQWYSKSQIVGSNAGNTVVNASPKMAGHCENLARLYQQAAEENIALSKEHRKMATDAKS